MTDLPTFAQALAWLEAHPDWMKMKPSHPDCTHDWEGPDDEACSTTSTWLFKHEAELVFVERLICAVRASEGLGYAETVRRIKTGQVEPRGFPAAWGKA